MQLMQPPNIQNPAIWSPQTLVNKPRRRFRCKMIELDLPRCQGTKDAPENHGFRHVRDASSENATWLFQPKTPFFSFQKNLDTLNQRVRPHRKTKTPITYIT